MSIRENRPSGDISFLSAEPLNPMKSRGLRKRLVRIKWKWARVLDIFEEEMLRGKTHEFIDYSFTFENDKYLLIDTPGHKCYIRSMLCGLSLYPQSVGCLVISLPEFESGWSRGTIQFRDVERIRHSYESRRDPSYHCAP